MENWKDIPESQGRYSVSDLGRIRRNAYSYKFGGTIVVKEEEILNHKPSKDYIYFGFTINKIRYRTSIHRWVAKAFIPNPENKPFVNHKDLNKWNNQVSNLEWATPSENNYHSRSSQKYKNRVKIKAEEFYNMEGEEFRMLQKGLFISNYGRIYGKSYNVMRFITPSISKGYSVFGFNKKNLRLHRLVALLFLDNPDNLPIVNHKDGDTSNNNELNLEWATHSYNTKHAYDIGLNNSTGEKQYNSKFSKETVVSIVNMLGDGFSYTQISKKTGVSTTQISNIKHGHTWASVTGVIKSPKTSLNVLNEDQVRRIKELACSGMNLSKIGKMFNQSYVNTYKIATGYRWAYVAPELTIKKNNNA